LKGEQINGGTKREELLKQLDYHRLKAAYHWTEEALHRRKIREIEKQLKEVK